MIRLVLGAITRPVATWNELESHHFSVDAGRQRRAAAGPIRQARATAPACRNSRSLVFPADS